MNGSLLDRPTNCLIKAASESPGLLVSVRSACEAQAAISGGADWIDLKEPEAGALGAVCAATAKEIVEVVADRRPVSAALGELSDWPQASARELLDLPGIQYVKLGLAGMDDVGEWQSRWQLIDDRVAAAGKRLVAVSYADWQRASAPSPWRVMELAEHSHARTMLIDTYDKCFPGTLEQFGAEQLRDVAIAARSKRIALILAGKIGRGDIPSLPFKAIDLVAVRGAVCQGSRTSMVASELVALIKQELMGVASSHHVHASDA